jgi:tyrosinase
LSDNNTFRIRKEVNSLTWEELQNFRAAFATIMNLPNTDYRSFSYYAGLHGFPYYLCQHEPRDIEGWPLVHLFLPWHRAYLYFLEKNLQDWFPSVTIPYWDWRSSSIEDQRLPRAFSDETIDNAGAQPNPLVRFFINYPESGIRRYTTRYSGQFVMGIVDLPSYEEIDMILNTPTEHFEDFSEALRNIHNRVHLWTGGNVIDGSGNLTNGDMTVVPFAAFDPIFFSHHCMIDRIWWLWQKRNGIGEIPDYYRNISLAPFENGTVERFLDIYALGYDYGEEAIPITGEFR